MKKRLLYGLGALALVPALFITTSCQQKLPSEADPIDDNYRTMYEIFTGSFSDSNGDGIGDLNGIRNRLDYLNDGDINNGNDLGVQGIWLTPICKSPSYHKYDVDDYYTIDSDFGTEDDFKALLDDCHSRNMIVITDLVINHTSTSNPWFQAFKRARAQGDTENKYYDFYTYSETAKAGFAKLAGTSGYYECNFTGSMPELNFDNEVVREEMVKVAKYWIDLGVDGFRFDAARYIYYSKTAQNVEFWTWYVGELKKLKADIYTIGEVLNGSGLAAYNEQKEYFKALNVFNFEFSDRTGYIASACGGNAKDYVSNYALNFAGYKKSNPDFMMSLVISNHDKDRLATSLSPKNGKAQMAANLLLLTQGSPFIYYGEEIGMNGTGTDPDRRLPMNWGDDDTLEPQGGTVGVEQANGTVKDQINNGSSLLSHYRKVIKIRHKYSEIVRGNYEMLNIAQAPQSAAGFKITLGDSVIGLIHNTSTDNVEIPLDNINCEFTQLLDFVGVKSAYISGNKLVIGGQTSVIIK